jgi:hypothetical protein
VQRAIRGAEWRTSALIFDVFAATARIVWDGPRVAADFFVSAENRGTAESIGRIVEG